MFKRLSPATMIPGGMREYATMLFCMEPSFCMAVHIVLLLVLVHHTVIHMQSWTNPCSWDMHVVLYYVSVYPAHNVPLLNPGHPSPSHISGNYENLCKMEYLELTPFWTSDALSRISHVLPPYKHRIGRVVARCSETASPPKFALQILCRSRDSFCLSSFCFLFCYRLSPSLSFFTGFPLFHSRIILSHSFHSLE